MENILEDQRSKDPDKSKEAPKWRSLFRDVGYVSLLFALSEMSYEIQESVYGRPSRFESLATRLGEPDYLTAFTYPLAVFSLVKLGTDFGMMMSKEVGDDFTFGFLRFIQQWTPALLFGLQLYHELFVHVGYADHPIKDIIAGAVAAGMGFMVSWFDNRKKIENHVIED